MGPSRRSPAYPSLAAPAGGARAWRCPRCPRCGGEVFRIRRRLIDRLLSLVLRLQRFRCLEMGCSWESNLRVSHRSAHAGAPLHTRPAPEPAGAGARR
jgi:hypothetical protein